MSASGFNGGQSCAPAITATTSAKRVINSTYEDLVYSGNFRTVGHNEKGISNRFFVGCLRWDVCPNPT